jgi:hypothetical protein
MIYFPHHASVRKPADAMWWASAERKYTLVLIRRHVFDITPVCIIEASDLLNLLPTVFPDFVILWRAHHPTRGRHLVDSTYKKLVPHVPPIPKDAVATRMYSGTLHIFIILRPYFMVSRHIDFAQDILDVIKTPSCGSRKAVYWYLYRSRCFSFPLNLGWLILNCTNRESYRAHCKFEGEHE